MAVTKSQLTESLQAERNCTRTEAQVVFETFLETMALIHRQKKS